MPLDFRYSFDVVLLGFDFDFAFRSGFSILQLFGFGSVFFIFNLKLRIVFLLEFIFGFRK